MEIDFSNCSYLTHHPKESLLEWNDDVMEVETLVCPKSPLHQRPGKRRGPLVLKGGAVKPNQIAWTWQNDMIVGVDVARFLKSNALSGLTLLPAYLSGSEVFEVRITGYGGIAAKQSGVRLLFQCKACGLKVYTCFSDPSTLLNPKEWDGSDVFFIWPLPRFFFATPKAKSILERFNGIEFQSPLSLRCDGTFTPGNLENYR